jgi:phage-related protein
MTTFTPPVTPSYGSAVKKKYNILESQFGDGYSARVGSGLNATKETWSLKWDILTDDEADEISEFFDARASVESFEWTTLHGDTLTFICREHDRSYDQFNNSTVTAELEQVFGS